MSTTGRVRLFRIFVLATAPWLVVNKGPREGVDFKGGTGAPDPHQPAVRPRGALRA